MRKIKKVKPSPPLGAKTGPVRIVERQGTAAPNGGFFAIQRVDTGEVIAGRWSLDNAIGFCHQNLIPIEAILPVGRKAK